MFHLAVVVWQLTGTLPTNSEQRLKGSLGRGAACCPWHETGSQAIAVIRTIGRFSQQSAGKLSYAYNVVFTDAFQPYHVKVAHRDLVNERSGTPWMMRKWQTRRPLVTGSSSLFREQNEKRPDS